MQTNGYSSLNVTVMWLSVIAFLILPTGVSAGDSRERDCPRAEAKGADGTQIEFRQYQFPDGTSDLILSQQGESGSMDIKRVTYGGGKTEGCHYKAVAIVPGGGDKQWGWHLAWAGSLGIRYARMDGNAWVSSPPKRLSTSGANDVHLQVNGTELLIWWREQNGDKTEIYQSVSHDEGRSWEAPQQFHPAN
jgi:hypothetical protein